jgi:preprotein translocase SecE subunit
VAGETRRQRRDARRAAGEDTGRGGTARPVPVGPQGTPAEPTVDHGRRGGFIRESIGELKKVEWPNRAQVIQGTIVVIVACAIVGAYLWGADQILKPFVRDVLLGQ